MTAPYVDVDPDGILIPQRLDGSALGDNPPIEDVSRWHIAEPKQKTTWCGLFLSQGNEQRRFSETPVERRCATCLRRFSEAEIHHPDA